MNILDSVGNTPMFHLTKFNSKLQCNLFAKCEMFNPTLSIKDRVVLFMLRKYEQEGILKPGGIIYEASSGNTGTSLAMFASILGYKAVITVPEKISQEKVNAMLAFGAEVIISPKGVAADSSEHYSNKAKILSQQHLGSIYFNQYGNENNPLAHYTSTAPEIWQQIKGQIDYLVIPASSGGTISGIGRFVKEHNLKTKIILPDPVGSIFYDYFYKNEMKYKGYKVEGAGKDKVCNIHDFSIIDDVIQFTDEEAFNAAKKLAKTEGIFSGGSSGGALAVAEKIARKTTNLATKPTIVVILPDSGFKYLSKFYKRESAD